MNTRGIAPANPAATEWARVHRIVFEAPTGFSDTRVMSVEVSRHRGGKISYCLGWDEAGTFRPFRNVPHARFAEAMTALALARSWAIENLGARDIAAT